MRRSSTACDATPAAAVIDTGDSGAAAAVALRQVSKTYRGRGPCNVMALREVTLHVDVGEFISVVGPSGCGKSTLLNLIAGLDTPSAGDIQVRAEAVDGRTGHVAHMPQRDLLMPWRTTLDNVILGPELRGVPRAVAHAAALEHFPRFGLAGFERAYPATLSGGMRQRAALLRTILYGRDILLLDEPFGALDALTRRQMQAWLLSIREEFASTVLLVTHDVEEAVFLSDRVYVMTPRPGAIKLEIAVALPRPRDPSVVGTPAFVDAKRRLLAALFDQP